MSSRASGPAPRTANLRRVLKGQGHALRVRQGDVVEEILGEVAAIGVPVLAMGYHRGGPPGLAEGGASPVGSRTGPRARS